MVWRGVTPSRTLVAEQDVKCASDTVSVEEEVRYIALPCCTITPPPECEPRRAEVPGAEEGRRAISGSPIQRTRPSVRSARQSVVPVERVVERGECGAGLVCYDAEWRLSV